MKKVVTAILGILLLGWTNLFAINPIYLGVHYDDPIPTSPGHGKSPIQPPTIWQDGYQIIFESGHPVYMLNIVQDDVTVYSTIVSSEVTTIILPSWLEGECEIQLYNNSSYYYYGTIIFN